MMFRSVAFLVLFGSLSFVADGQVFSDSLKPGVDRPAGSPLNLQVPETGGGKWRALKGLVVSPAGATAEAASGAHLVVPEIAGSIRIEGDVSHIGSGFTALALGRGDLSGNFWANLSIMVLLAGDRWQIHAAGKDWFVKPSAGLLKSEGPNHLDFRLDTLARTATFSINGKTVVDAAPLPENVRTDGITAAGFRFHEPVVAGKPVLSDFRVELEPRAIAGMELVSPAMAFVTPDAKSVIQWQVASRGPSDEAAYVVRNYAGEETGKGVAKLDAENKVTLEREFAAGYSEITLAATNRTFGVVAIPPGDKVDPFFALDAGLSWLELDPERREGLVKIAARSGITMVRERLGLGNITSGKGKFDFETPRQFETLRKAYAANGVDILEILDGGKSAKPGNFPEMAAAIGEVAKHWTMWGGAEASNEPDLKPVPADDYVPLVKAMSRALKEAGSKVPVVAGAFATIPPGPYFDTCAANGMLEDCDAVSFHSYDRATGVEAMVRRYRTWMKEAGKEALPLWHTECGWPWVNGPARPPYAQDADSAMEIVAKAMESKACGVARHFPFVFTYYEEGLKNFSMMGREVSPLRSMAAYVQCVRMLSGKSYVGDLPDLGGPVKLARVFGGKADRVAVIYTGKIDAEQSVLLKQPVLKALGADGREIRMNPDGTLPVPDGLAYLVLGKDAVVASDTTAMKLHDTGAAPLKQDRRASPLLIQFLAESLPAKVSSRRYLISKETAKRFPLNVRVHNLSAEEIRFTPGLRWPGGKTEKSAAVTVPARGNVEVAWTPDLSGVLDIAETRLVSVTGESDGENPLPLAIPLVMEGDLEEHLKRHPNQEAVPIADPKLWTANMAGHGKGTFTAKDGVWRHEMTFSTPTGSWTYPKFALARPIDPEKFSGFIIRGRIADRASAVAVIAATPGAPSFWVPDLFPADGEWHVVHVPFAEFKPGPGGAGNQNTRLDPAAWRALSIGMGSRTAKNSIEVSHWILVGE